ncbi:MAG: serine/threonine-protein kinase [Pirellulaceae bacterium]
MVDSEDLANNPGQESGALEIDETAMIGEIEAAALHSTVRPRLAGDTFGRYRVLKTLGEGAMGSVYLALDSQLQRKVALKIPKVDAKEQPRFVERFLREARSAATLTHPNICPVYDVGEIEGQHFITMAYIQGHSLSEFVNPTKPQNERHIATVVRKIALALYDAHANGLVHRDVKPANVMIDLRNEPIIMDFGLARQLDDGEDSRLTRDGAILGSPAYMSPEQIEGHASKIGPACDIYSLGVILYELLTGRLPFQGSVASIIGQILSKEPVHPCKVRPDISPRLADVCTKAMAKKPQDRYSSMKELASALADFLKSRSDEPTDRRDRRERDRRDGDSSDLRERDEPRERDDSRERGRTAGERTAGERSSGSRSAGTGSRSGAKSSSVELKPESQALEVTCHCGQRMVAKVHMAGKMVRCPRCADIVQIPAARSSTRQQQVACQGCGQRFLAREDLAGKVVKCPMCSKPLTVPLPGSVSNAAPQIEVHCVCGQQFLARPDLAGKRVKCTSCGRPLAIPRPS